MGFSGKTTPRVTYRLPPPCGVEILACSGHANGMNEWAKLESWEAGANVSVWVEAEWAA